MQTIELQRVQYMPSTLTPGILYVSEEFNVAAHLCACGCGNKTITPLGKTEWSFSVEQGKPTLYPSIGNWQLPCRSHYWIIAGEIEWSYQWSEKQIKAGRQAEERRRQLYYERINRRSKRYRIFDFIKKWLFRKS